MDQVFLQDSIPPRRHPTRRALKRETPSQPPQSASPVGPGENQLLGLKLITSSPLKPHSRITMTNHGDDCYFFYYSTCAKGDSCPFRHCEAAMGNETVCSLWQEGRCFRTVCKFRHMKITKNRKEIPCYWENQPAGCQKAHCAFSHEKPRYIEGIFMPPDKSLNKNEEQQQEETPPPPAAAAAAALPTTANPQLRGIIKTETQEPVPSPTHPPVVINPADDDEDEDDQFSEEGEDSKFGPSPRKLPKSDDSLNFGVSTLEEIRLRKALKASMKKAGYPIQSAETSANGEKENIQSFFRPAVFESRDGTGVARGSVNERLVRKIPNTDVKSGEGVRLKRSLAERLGRIVDVEEPSTSPQKSLKPVKERLGLLSGPAAPTQSAETVVVSKKVPEHIHIKTLEEIKQEKAAKCQSQNDASSTETPEVTAPKSAATKSVKRAITAKHSTVSHVKTFSEVIRAKKKRQEEEKLEPSPISKKAKHMVEDAPGKSRVESDAGGPGPAGAAVGKVRVKTLEEIRKEKAARIQAQQTREAEIKKSSDTEENGTKKPRLLAIKKTASQSGIITTEESSEVTEKPLQTSAAASETSNSVKVKTFEEIMQEKRLRKQEMDEQAKSSAEAELSQNRTAGGSLKRNALAKISLASSSSPSSATPVPDSTQNPVRKRIPLEAKAASPLKSMTTRNTAAAALPTVAPVSSAQQAETESQSSSREVLDKNTRNSTALSPMKPAKTGPPGPATDAPAAAKTQNNNQKKPPECTADTKVRPKLNVKPSVMKPAVQVKPGQKRKAAERSAVAAVKPLNSASTVQEEPLQETACRDRQVFPSFGAEAHLISAVPCSPTTLLDNGSSPPREELQTVPDFKQSPGQEKRTVASTVPQSPVRKTPTQPKSRRASVAASRIASTSAMDDFEELINEFTDDHLEEDVDPGIGEDVLLRELSEMIDS